MGMSRLRIGIVRYASVANNIAAALAVDRAPEVLIGARTKIIFRSLGAARWSEEQQISYALQVAAVARRAIAADSRRSVYKRAENSAMVVIFEDATLKRGCSIVSRWECVVPAASSA